MFLVDKVVPFLEGKGCGT